ncbi:hypothetical protein JCM10908_002671 [Rhodotorula pacifica]|uniref:uncharacterized protein n=1 Tax=Rhodotorula pacifica TaxID=1495444 RepID=UPI003181F8CF
MSHPAPTTTLANEDRLLDAVRSDSPLGEAIQQARQAFSNAGATPQWNRFEEHLLGNLDEHGIGYFLHRGQHTLRPLAKGIAKVGTALQNAHNTLGEKAALEKAVSDLDSPAMNALIQTSLAKYQEWDQSSTLRIARSRQDPTAPRKTGLRPQLLPVPARQRSPRPTPTRRNDRSATPSPRASLILNADKTLFQIAQSNRNLSSALASTRQICINAGAHSQWAQFEASLLARFRQHQIYSVLSEAN